MTDQITLIEDIITQNVKRNISRLTDFARGSLARAAASIVETSRPHVGIVTGFFIKHAIWRSLASMRTPSDGYVPAWPSGSDRRPI